MGAGNPFIMYMGSRLPSMLIRLIGQFLGPRCTWCEEHAAVPVRHQTGDWNWVCVQCVVGTSGGPAVPVMNRDGEWSWLQDEKNCGCQPDRHANAPSNLAASAASSSRSTLDPREGVMATAPRPYTPLAAPPLHASTASSGLQPHRPANAPSTSPTTAGTDDHSRWWNSDDSWEVSHSYALARMASGWDPLQNFLCISPGLSKYRFDTRDRGVLERVDKTQAQSWLALNLNTTVFKDCVLLLLLFGSILLSYWCYVFQRFRYRIFYVSLRGFQNTVLGDT